MCFYVGFCVTLLKIHPVEARGTLMIFHWSKFLMTNTALQSVFYTWIIISLYVTCVLYFHVCNFFDCTKYRVRFRDVPHRDKSSCWKPEVSYFGHHERCVCSQGGKLYAPCYKSCAYGVSDDDRFSIVDPRARGGIMRQQVENNDKLLWQTDDAAFNGGEGATWSLCLIHLPIVGMDGILEIFNISSNAVKLERQYAYIYLLIPGLRVLNGDFFLKEYVKFGGMIKSTLFKFCSIACYIFSPSFG